MTLVSPSRGAEVAALVGDNSGLGIPLGPYDQVAGKPGLNEFTSIYHLLPDRHRRGGGGEMDLEHWQLPVFVGGNFEGITEDLPRIADLGYDEVWMGPFTKGPGYHGYHPEAMDEIDPHFGDESKLLALTARAHELGLRVMIDVVPNHCSDQHPFYQKAIGRIPLEPGDPDDGYRDWFRFDRFPDKPQTFLHYGDLIKFNVDNPEVVKYLQAAFRKWKKLGVDDFRVDHIIGLSNRNVDDLFGPLKKEFPDMKLIGEAWMGDDGCRVAWRDLNTIRVCNKRLIWSLGRVGLETTSSALLYRNYMGRLDGVLDFTAAKMLETYATANSPRQKAQAKNRLIKWTNKFRGKLLQVVFADNHDMPRAMYRYGDDPKVFKDTMELAYSLDQPVANYHGTEYGATQDGEFGDWHGDLKAREPLELIQARQVPGMFNFFKGIVSRRKQRSAVMPQREAA
ncbi:MAG TPA: alpha-amylase family glycosyl hydrolase [Candidatus Limnocylindrales bacterium]|nr:alpha-amylase family glycosyl hydrolase [Candidatus Limnocylindrales bacterium]